ncbi:AAA family ATPase, partial [Mycobacterium tuberculosis]|nr:AAA family ATPase [Mycobacterium tuberculosis]
YILSKLDGYDRHNGVIVVGATNFPRNLDPALLRPGRLDRHIDLQLPDDVGRAEILHFYLPSIPISDLIQTASATYG